ncbi:hypothetical protein F2Q68_00023610 [Brassica cretica]|uniref:Uncharacterized protein n=1 Tax=Brassica cretica TaxID=69181 RepID=A0A8S9FUD0_BRACR|nr:hypothetical protein F2Q68_00023610 [Brassica cretica]
MDDWKIESRGGSLPNSGYRFCFGRRHLIYGGVRPLCLWEGEASSFYFAGLRFREAVAFSVPLSSALSLDLCSSALDRVCMALYGPQGPVEEMSRFVGGLVACSLEIRSRLCVGSGERPAGFGGLSQAVKAMGGSDMCPRCHSGFDT